MASGINGLSSGTVPVNSDLLKVQQETKTQSELDKDAFIQLLVTQMQYQDPLEPMDNSEMLAQMAQFTALEQMMNVALASNKQLASGMIGKYVEYNYTDPTTGAMSSQYGKVDYVNINGDDPLLGIGDQEIKLSDVHNVVEQKDVAGVNTAFDLIGKTVQASVPETAEDGSLTMVTIEGEVSKINLKNSKPYVVIGNSTGNYEIDFDNVQNVVQNKSVTGREIEANYYNSNGEQTKVSGIAEYIRVDSEGTKVYVDGKFVNFNDITSVK